MTKAQDGTKLAQGLQAKLRGTQGALKRAQNAAADARDKLRAICTIVGLPEDVGFHQLAGVIRGKFAQSGERLADNEELRLLLQAICTALRLPKDASQKDVVDAIMALSDQALAGRQIAEAVSQEWAGLKLEMVSLDSLVKMTQNLKQLVVRLRGLASMAESCTPDELFLRIEAMATHGRCSYVEEKLRELLANEKTCDPRSFSSEDLISEVTDLYSLAREGMAISDGLCGALSLPEGTAIPAIVAAVKGQRELLERYQASGYMPVDSPNTPPFLIANPEMHAEADRSKPINPTGQVMAEMRKILGLAYDTHPAVVGSRVIDIVKRQEVFAELCKLFELPPDAAAEDCVREVVYLQRINQDNVHAVDDADRELTALRKTFAHLQASSREMLNGCRRLAATAKVLGEVILTEGGGVERFLDDYQWDCLTPNAPEESKDD